MTEAGRGGASVPAPLDLAHLCVQGPSQAARERPTRDRRKATQHPVNAVTQDDSMLDDTAANTATTTEIETPEGTTITETTGPGDEPDSNDDDLDPDDDSADDAGEDDE